MVYRSPCKENINLILEQIHKLYFDFGNKYEKIGVLGDIKICFDGTSYEKNEFVSLITSYSLNITITL